ncbi:MAG: chloride channel protein, partial [Methanomassiliicoccales archaeon]|nr:chloride channel protein [Methanomassiliicoccales archaeon]
AGMAEESKGPTGGDAGASGSLMDKAFITITLLCGVVGIIAGLFTAVFFLTVFPALDFIWTTVPNSYGITGTDMAIYTVAICTLGGLVVGLTIKLTREPATVLAEEMDEVAESGRIRPRGGIANLVRGSFAIIFGGSVGPEGPLIAGSGAIGTWLADKTKLPSQGVAAYTFAAVSGTMGSFFGNPFAMSIITVEGSLEKGHFSWRMLIPGIVASTTGYVVFFILTGSVMGKYTFPPYPEFHLYDLGYAVILGAIGAAIGLAFIYVFQWMRRRTTPYKRYPVIQAVIGGLILGIVGVLFPLTLFTGETQVNDVIEQAATLGVVMLLVLALVKMLLTSWCIGTGWAGGYIFPTLFMGAAVGMAISIALPFIPAGVCLACVMGAIFVSVFKSPIAVTMITATLFTATLIPAATIAVITSLMITYAVPLIPKATASKS